MKTVESVVSGKLSRVKDSEAIKLVHLRKTHRFVPKSRWKERNK